VVDVYRGTTAVKSYEQGYEAGFDAGFKAAQERIFKEQYPDPSGFVRAPRKRGNPHPKKKRKLSAWNKFVKANSKKPRFVYRSGKLNLKKMGVAFRKTPAGKKGKR